MDLRAAEDALARGGFIAADEEAAELSEAAGGDGARLAELVARRLTGEPLAWITGWAELCGVRVVVHPGVYVPRWHSEVVVARVLEVLPPAGTVIDLCTGSGALGKVLRTRRPDARVVGTDIDSAAVACAQANGVDAVVGDLYGGLPAGLAADVVTGVVPYVPTQELGLLQRDTFTFESTTPYDGGATGTAVLQRALDEAPAWLRPGGHVVLELGGELATALDLTSWSDIRLLRDEDGDIRGLSAVNAPVS